MANSTLKNQDMLDVLSEIDDMISNPKKYPRYDNREDLKRALLLDEETVINFSNCEKYLKFYNGKNGNKSCVIYNGKHYMLKSSIKKEKSYSVFSEYISCQIYASLGFNVQETMLGTYIPENKTEERIVVACKDFTFPNKEFYDFASIKNDLYDSESGGYGVELSDVLGAIEGQNYIPSKELKDFFWCMFIVDSMLGNFDRHNGNWGFLVDRDTEEITIAPIFDCGSCLLPQATDEMLKTYLEDKGKFEKRIYIFPNSALRIGQNKINPYDFISSLENEDCNKALLETVPKINLEKINDIIDNTPVISDIRKEFYKKYIEARYKLILLESYNKLVSKEN